MFGNDINFLETKSPEKHNDCIIYSVRPSVCPFIWPIDKIKTTLFIYYPKPNKYIMTTAE